MAPAPGMVDARVPGYLGHLGPLSQAETMKLVWALPQVGRLSEAELVRVWRGVGRHPRALEYLDALLARGKAEGSAACPT